MKGHDFAAMLSTEFGVKGTAGLPVVFLTDNGSRAWVAGDIVTTETETQVLLLEEGQ